MYFFYFDHNHSEVFLVSVYFDLFRKYSDTHIKNMQFL